MTGPFTGGSEGSAGGPDGGYTGGSTGNESQGNPAWNEFLQVVPQELHSQVTPVLQKWDQGVNERFNKVHSEYEPYKPFKDAGIPPEDLQFAVNLMNSLTEDPQTVYKAIGEFYKLNTPEPGSNSGQGQSGPPTEQDDPYSSRFSEIERQNQILAQHFIQQREAQENAQADYELDSELASLRQKYGDYDERYVLALMQNGMGGDEAVQQFQSFVTNEAAKYRPKPLIMGGGGGLPGQRTDPKKMSDAETKNYVAQILAAAQQQRQ